MSNITRTKAIALRKIIEKAVASLDDIDALEAVQLYPHWQVEIDYSIGDRVSYENVLYKCLQSHTSQFNWIPTQATSLWSKVLIPDPEVIPEWVQPDSTNPYMKGDKVSHNEQNWESAIDYNVWEPGIYGWNII